MPFSRTVLLIIWYTQTVSTCLINVLSFLWPPLTLLLRWYTQDLLILQYLPKHRVSPHKEAIFLLTILRYLEHLQTFLNGDFIFLCHINFLHLLICKEYTEYYQKSLYIQNGTEHKFWALKTSYLRHLIKALSKVSFEWPSFYLIRVAAAKFH